MNESLSTEQRLALLEARVNRIESALPQGNTGVALNGFVWPSSYKPAWITQMYRANPQNYLKYGLDGHEGIDIRTGTNGKCICIFDGVVSRVDAWPNTGNYGYSIRVFHPMTGHTSIYAHLDPSVSVPPVGMSVIAGQVLGLCDSTGNSSAAHLHLSIKNGAGEFIDPMLLLADAYHAAGGAQKLPPIGAPMTVKK